MSSPELDRELKKGSAELLILSLVEDRPRHGYDIGQLIELRSRGALRFNVASLYPLLYRLEKRGWIRGRWVEKAGQRRRRYYRLTPAGREMLGAQGDGWREFLKAIGRIAGIEYAGFRIRDSCSSGETEPSPDARSRDRGGAFAAS